MNADHLSNFDKEALCRLSFPTPFNEEKRLKVLGQTQALNSNDIDPAFDKFTAICQRFLNVPIALISLVDVNKQWLKSKIGLDALQTDRNSSFCAYTILPESPDVFVIADTLSDERFSKNILVTGFPFIRFYAGAALIVEGVRMGSLCIMDIEARDDFSQEDRMNLRDLASAVSSLIASQRKAERTIQSMKSEKIMDDMMHQVRTPLMSIQLNTSLVESSQLELAEYLKDDTHGTKLSNNVTTSLSDLKCAISQLDTFVAASLQLNEHHVQYDKAVNKDASNVLPAKKCPSLSHWNDLFLTIQNSLSLLSRSIEIEWSIDDRLTDATIRSHPELMAFIIGFLIDKAFTYWKNANITINFKSYNDLPNLGDTTATTTNYSQNIKSNSNINDIKYGYLSIMINLSRPKAAASASSSNNSNHLAIDLQTIEKELHDIGGDFRSFNFDATSSSSYFESQNTINEQFFEFCVPCDLFSSNYRAMVSRKNSIFIPTPNNNSSNSSTIISLTENNSSSSNDNNYSTNVVVMDNQCGGVLIDKSGGSSPSASVRRTAETPMDISTLPLLEGDTIVAKASKIGNPSHFETEEKANNNSNNNSIRSIHPPQELSYRSLSDYKTLKVLIVDDSVAITKVLKRWLEAEGCQVTVAENGSIGLTHLQSQSFDITLMDFIMPVMLGRDAMRLFQEWRLESCLHNINDDMLLVGMSANASQRDQEEAYQYGMHFFAAKPVDLDFLSIILSAKSKHSSLAKVVRTITISNTKAKDNAKAKDTDTVEGSSNVFIQRKKARLKKASSVSALYTYNRMSAASSSPAPLLTAISKKGTGTAAGHDNDNDTEITATDVNIDFTTSRIKAASTGTTYLRHHHHQDNPSPAASAAVTPAATTSNTRTLLSRFRRNIFSQLFKDLSITDSKINPYIAEKENV